MGSSHDVVGVNKHKNHRKNGTIFCGLDAGPGCGAAGAINLLR